jgi:hypothetical protein
LIEREVGRANMSDKTKRWRMELAPSATAL